MRIRTLFASTIVAVAITTSAVVAGCSAGLAPSAPTPSESSAVFSPSPPAANSPTSADFDPVDVPTGGQPSTDAQVEPPGTEGSNPTTPSVADSSAADAVEVTTAPDAVAGASSAIREQFASRGWLTGDDRVMLRADTQQETATGAALCEYVFGASTDVAARAALPAGVELMSLSGVRPSAAGAFLLCAYGRADRPQAVLEIGHSTDPWDNGITTLVQDGDVHAVLSYVPDFAGTLLAEAEATSWLRDALTRLAY